MWGEYRWGNYGEGMWVTVVKVGNCGEGWWVTMVKVGNCG